MGNKNKQPFNKLGQAHGPWEAYHIFYNELWYKAFYINGNAFGLYQNFNNKGEILVLEYYAR